MHCQLFMSKKYIFSYCNMANCETAAHAPWRCLDILGQTRTIHISKAKNIFFWRYCRGTETGIKLTVEFSNRKEGTFLQFKGLFFFHHCNCSWNRWTNIWPSDILNYVSLMARSSFQLILHLVDGLKCTLICIVPQVWHYLCRATQVDSIFFSADRHSSLLH